MKGAALNQDPALEREADQMGARAASLPTVGPTPCAPAEAVFPDRAAPAQCAGRASATTAIQGEGVIQLYAAWADVQDAKHKPTANFTEQEKLTIANWCQVQNTNTLRAVHARDYQHNHAETSNNINYVFAFDWDLAIHVDFGGPAHGNVDTPHLQAVRALHGLHGSTQAAIEIAKANAAPAPLGQALPYIDASNAVALTMQQAQACMNANNLDGVKNLIQPKLKAFGEDWARTYADKDSGAKAARAAEDQDVGNLFDEP
jgi:hypothetical protein